VSRRLGVRLLAFLALLCGTVVVAPPAGATGERVYVLYDSVLNGARDQVTAALQGAGYDPYLNGFPGMRLEQGIGQIRDHRREIGGIAIIHLGNNFLGPVNAFSSQIDEAMRALDGVDTVVFLTVQEARATQVQLNRQLYEALARWPNMRVADWRALAHPPNVGGSEIHLSRPGRDAMAKLVLDEVRAWSASLVPPPGTWAAFGPTFRGGVEVAAGRGAVVAGAGPGGGPQVSVFDPAGGARGAFLAYDGAFRGGVRVATCDTDGDGSDEIVTAPGPGGGPDVRVFRGDGTRVGGFLAYASGFTGGVSVACGDLDGDGRDEIVTAPDAGGGPDVREFTAAGTLLRSFSAYDPRFTGGVRVAVGGGDIVTAPGRGGGPDVRVWGADTTPIARFLAYAPDFTSGVFVAAGDVDGDGQAEIVAAGGSNAAVRDPGPPRLRRARPRRRRRRSRLHVHRLRRPPLGPPPLIFLALSRSTAEIGARTRRSENTRQSAARPTAVSVAASGRAAALPLDISTRCNVPVNGNGGV
jgi:hypothetical protein